MNREWPGSGRPRVLSPQGGYVTRPGWWARRPRSARALLTAGARAVTAAAIAALVLTATACVLWESESSGDETASAERKLADVRRLYGGDVFFLGTSFEGRPLTDVVFGDEAGPATVGFSYGDCERPGWPQGFDSGGCPAPFDIQNVVCADGRTLVAVFANSKAMARRAAQALRPLGKRAGRPPEISLGRSEDCGNEATATDREIVRSLVAFARSPADATWRAVPFARKVDLGLANRLFVRRSAAELRNPAAWLIDVRSFRGGTRPFSAVSLIDENAHGRLALSVGPHRHCVSPPVPPPRRVAALRRVSLQPKQVESCLQWWTVDLYLTGGGKVRAVTLDLWEP